MRAWLSGLFMLRSAHYSDGPATAASTQRPVFGWVACTPLLAVPVHACEQHAIVCRITDLMGSTR